MSAATEVALCNLALSMVGVRAISSFADDSKEARLCNTFYPHLRDRLQESHRWGFCIKRANLTATGTPAVWEFDHQFALPADYLRLLDIQDEEEYQREGEFIYTHSETINILYIAKITDTTLFPFAFTQALACELASMLAYPLHQDKALKNMMAQEAELWKAKARSSGAMESSAKELNPITFINSRY